VIHILNFVAFNATNFRIITLGKHGPHFVVGWETASVFFRIGPPSIHVDIENAPATADKLDVGA